MYARQHSRRPASTGNASSGMAACVSTGETTSSNGASASNRAAVPRLAAATAPTYSPVPMRSPSATTSRICGVS